MKYRVELLSMLKNEPESWHVVGPYHPAPHVTATWSCVSKHDAENLCERMNNGFVPPIDRESFYDHTPMFE